MNMIYFVVNPLSANPPKWSNTLKQFVGNFPTNCLGVFDHFVWLAFKGLSSRAYVIQKFNQRLIIEMRKNERLYNYPTLF